ncbi:hypothetical protein V7P28_25320, partial [Klebsiella michiganensis]
AHLAPSLMPGSCWNMVNATGAGNSAFPTTRTRLIFCPFNIAGLPFPLFFILNLSPFRVCLFLALTGNGPLLILTLLFKVTL